MRFDRTKQRRQTRSERPMAVQDLPSHRPLCGSRTLIYGDESTVEIPRKSRRKPQPEAVPPGILQLFCSMIAVILLNDSAGSAARAALLAVFVGHPRESRDQARTPDNP